MYSRPASSAASTESVAKPASIIFPLRLFVPGVPIRKSHSERLGVQFFHRTNIVRCAYPLSRVPRIVSLSDIAVADRPTQSSTSKHITRGETILLCQKKKQLNESTKTSVKVNRPALRRASLCAKKWNTFGKANMGRVRRSRRSPSVSRRRGGRE